MAEPIVIHVDEETRRRLSKACAAIMNAIVAQTMNAGEAHACLKMCLQTLEETCGIADTIIRRNPTEKLQ